MPATPSPGSGDRLPLTVHRLFEAQARARPDAVALVQGDRQESYGALDARADRIAHGLLDLGVGRGARVGTFLARSPDAVAAMLAILKLGAVYVPFDPDYPAEVLATAAAVAGVAAMVGHARLGAMPGGPDTPCLHLDGEAIPVADLGAADLGDPAPEDGGAGPSDPAYVMFTSGSTGRPKGVVVPHRGIVRLVCRPDYIALGPDEVVLQVCPLAFDASTLEIWGCLLNGGRLVFPAVERPSLGDLGDAMGRHAITTMMITAALFHLLVDQQLAAFASLRQVVVGGDVLSPSHVETLRVAHPGCQVINAYGPTENTTITCAYPVPRDAQVTGAIPVGRPIAGTTVRVLDGALAPVPDGSVGQLATGGEGLALGYLGEPGLTAERFVPDPLDPGGRLYLTGDLVRRRPDGIVEFLGRADRQVKVNGRRLELEEVETALHACPGVREAAALLREDGAGGRRLAAYVSGTGLDVAALRHALRARLPEHAVPADIVVLDALPVSPMGKIDRAALPAPAHPAMAGGSRPRGAAEGAIAAVWTRVLGLPAVDRDRSFFDAGGTSLQLLEVLAELQARLGPQLRMPDLFDHPTIAGLAAFLQGAASPDAGGGAERERARQRAEALTRSQQRRAGAIR